MGGAGSGRGGLSIEVVKECMRLVGLGWSTQRIANELEIGDCTVKRIRRGEHFLQLAMDEQNPAYVRCPDCGGLIIAGQPCLLDQLRRAGL